MSIVVRQRETKEKWLDNMVKLSIHTHVLKKARERLKTDITTVIAPYIVLTKILSNDISSIVAKEFVRVELNRLYTEGNEKADFDVFRGKVRGEIGKYGRSSTIRISKKISSNER